MIKYHFYFLLGDVKNAETVKNTITIANNVAFPTLRKGKAFKALVFVASEVQKTLTPGSVHTVPMSLFTGLLKFKLSNIETASIMEDLEKIRLDWSSYNEDWSGFSHVVSSCRYDSKRDSITFSFDPMFVTEYLDRRTPFKNIPISLIMGFRSNYALKIYELAYQYYDPSRKEGRTPSCTYEELRSLFNLEKGQYKNSGHFFQKVIKNPIKETSEITDYIIDLDTNRKRGALRRYWFSIKLNPQAKFDFAKIDKHDRFNPGDEEELEKMQQEERARAKRFLEFWEDEFNAFAKRSLTQDERKMWVDPLLETPAQLTAFAESWIIETYLKCSEEKKRAFFSKQELLPVLSHL